MTEMNKKGKDKWFTRQGKQIICYSFDLILVNRVISLQRVYNEASKEVSQVTNYSSRFSAIYL